MRLTILIMCYALFFPNLQSSELQSLPEKRTHNLILLNDFSEFDSPVKFPWSKQPFTPRAITTELIMALSHNQLTICPKVLWHHLQYYANMFKDLATLSPQNFQEQYELPSSTLKDIQQYQELCKPIYQKISPTLIQRFWQTVGSSSFTTSTDPTLHGIVTAYIHYQRILQQNFTCKAISKDFILFVPQQLTGSIDLNPGTLTEKKGISRQDLFLGIRYYNYETYSYKESLSQYYQLPQDPESAFIKTLQSIAISPHNLRPEYQEYSYKVLPQFNVYLSGHGSETETAGLSIKLNKTTQKSVFLQFLKTLEDQYFTKSLTTLSCFTGGKKVADTFQATSLFDASFLTEISYPIIMTGTTFSPAFIASPPQQKSLTTKVAYAQNMFENLFRALNQAPPRYDQAAQAVSFNPSTTQTQQEALQLHNFAMIRMPNSQWFTPISYQKHVKNLSQITMTTATKPIVISDKIQIVLLSANRYPQTIKFNHDATPPTFIPSNYINQTYMFRAMTFDYPYSIHFLLSHFFKIKEIQEPITITIDKLTIKGKTYKDVHIFMYKTIANSTKPQYGYQYFDPIQNKTFTTHWDFDQSFPKKFEEKKLKEQDKVKKTSQPQSPSTITQEFTQRLESIISKGPSFHTTDSQTTYDRMQLAQRIKANPAAVFKAPLEEKFKSDDPQPLKKQASESLRRKFAQWLAPRFKFARKALLKEDLANNPTQAYDLFDQRILTAKNNYLEKTKKLQPQNLQLRQKYLKNLQRNISQEQELFKSVTGHQMELSPHMQYFIHEQAK